MLTVKEYAQYLLDNFPHDAPVMSYSEVLERFYFRRTIKLIKREETEKPNYLWWGVTGFPEGVEQIVVI